MLKFSALMLCVAAAAMGLVACGGSSSSSKTTTTTTPAQTSSPAATSSTTAAATGGSSGALALAADPSGQLKFDKSSLGAKSGKVTIKFTNMASVGHNLTIEKGTNGAVVGATPTFAGGSKTLTVNLPPGTYTFYCSVPGHRAAGMVGTLKVS
jgi:plastocyanin